MSDRYGRRPVLLLSLCGSALGFAVFGVGGALWVLVPGRVIEGLAARSISALYAYVADTHAPAERGPAFGMLGAAGGLGFMMAPVLGARHPAGGSWPRQECPGRSALAMTGFVYRADARKRGEVHRRGAAMRLSAA